MFSKKNTGRPEPPPRHTAARFANSHLNGAILKMVRTVQPLPPHPPRGKKGNVKYEASVMEQNKARFGYMVQIY